MLTSKLARHWKLENAHASWKRLLFSLDSPIGNFTNKCPREEVVGVPGALHARNFSASGPSSDNQNGFLSITEEYASISGGKKLLVSASGPDQPGIVSRLSKRVLECGGNVEESRMCRLAGDFTVLMLVSINGILPKKAEDLCSKLLEIEGLQVQARWATDVKQQKEQGHTYHQISLRGSDTPGLVYNLTEYLASHGVNIESLQTHTHGRWSIRGGGAGSVSEETSSSSTSSASAASMFSLEATVSIPKAVSPSRLLSELECLQRSMGTNITLAEIKDLERG